MRREVFCAENRLRVGLAALGIALFTICAGDADAAPRPAAKLVSCGENNCLQVSGRRSDPASVVQINGHPVTVEGGKAWKAVLPLQTVRIWSAPMARTIAVTVVQEGASGTQQAELPIGLLGHVTELALVVSSR
ncbi:MULTISPECIES: hypothetical protein [Novosphingobium]|jgi:hypothetical protein|uniref:hypothetical protein n=1 Tax=Novosphingobium TaxID=165696 RepID=UPI002329FAFF|nr:hypothetical protein [Novosphingobium sp. fls2-241-R2A-195]GLK44560.1 hypothetical protein GCM10017612_24800 [Novosphingobium resinovorum]